MKRHQLDKSYIEFSILTKYHHYQALELELSKLKQWQNRALMQRIQIAKAILNADLEQVKQFTQESDYTYLTKGTVLERKAYYQLQTMTLQLAREEYGDYLRALTPLLVDLLRIVIERDFMPHLSEYIIPVIKNTEEDKALYRGLQWSRDKIEATDNLIQSTWKKYYGDYFNYDHYVSSSHLIKLIETHATQPRLVELTTQLRQIEKYLRNIVAHEIIVVDRQFFKERMDTTPEAVHQLLLKVYQEAQLNDQLQRQSIMILRKDIQFELTKQYERIKGYSK